MPKIKIREIKSPIKSIKEINKEEDVEIKKETYEEEIPFEEEFSTSSTPIETLAGPVTPAEDVPIQDLEQATAPVTPETTQAPEEEGEDRGRLYSSLGSAEATTEERIYEPEAVNIETDLVREASIGGRAFSTVSHTSSSMDGRELRQIRERMHTKQQEEVQERKYEGTGKGKGRKRYPWEV